MMSDEDYNELQAEARYEAMGGADTGFCLCGNYLNSDMEKETGVCLECQ